MHRLILFCLLSGLCAVSIAQNSLSNVSVSKKEVAFVDEINRLRGENGLSNLELSVSLTYVAQQHVADLKHNRPDTSICTTASWSNKGKWCPCCCNKYVPTESCMRNKPKELTDYLYKGYELSYYSEDVITPSTLFSLLKHSPEATDMFLQRGNYQTNRWKVIGICIDKHYASIWFGQFPDKDGKPKIK